MKLSEVRIGSQKIKIEYVPVGHPEIGSNYGIYDPDKDIIYINKDVSEYQQQRALSHELLHVFMRSSGATTYLMDMGYREEVFVGIMEKGFHEFLKGIKYYAN